MFNGYEHAMTPSGKICFTDCILMSATPDIILYDLATEDINPAELPTNAVGVAEVKTTVLNAPRTYVGNHLDNWLRKTRPKQQASSLCNVRRKRPEWLHGRDRLYKKINRHSTFKAKWYVRFAKTDLKGNTYYKTKTLHFTNASINVFEGKIGRQLLAEMIAIEPFCPSVKYVTGMLYLVNIKSKSEPETVDSVIYCKIIIGKKYLRMVKNYIIAEFLYRFGLPGYRPDLI